MKNQSLIVNKGHRHMKNIEQSKMEDTNEQERKKETDAKLN